MNKNMYQRLKDHTKKRLHTFTHDQVKEVVEDLKNCTNYDQAKLSTVIFVVNCSHESIHSNLIMNFQIQFTDA